MRSRRMYRSRRLYEIVFRARKGLPLPPRPLVNLIIESALARTQRDHKVILCGQTWLGNHPHLLVYSLDVVDLKRFYEELKKRITDALKRLLGKRHLSIWDSKNTTVAEVLDLNKAIQRFGYVYLNPVRAKLVPSVDEYPGVSSWKALLQASPFVEACEETEVPWLRLPSIPRLSSSNPSKKEEQRVIRQLVESNKEMHKLKIYPFAWLKAFGVIEPKEVEVIKRTIISEVRQVEEELKIRRVVNRENLLGRDKLLCQGITWSHEPAKRERRIFFLSSISQLRFAFLEEYAAFCERCRGCYQKLRAGFTNITWPPGAFAPAIPPLINPI